jgi:hypothetical protein
MTVLSNTSIAGGAANNIAPNYVEGTMFANDDEFYLYGSVPSSPFYGEAKA